MITAAKGYRMRRSKLYRYASDAVDHGRQYAYRDRRVKKRTFRYLWQIRINAAVRALGMTYSRFMEGIKAAGALQLWAADWNAPCLSTDVRAFASDMDVNAVYTYGMTGSDGLTYAESRAAYSYAPARPAYLKETGYEDEVILPGDSSSVRKYEYWAVLGGATADSVPR